MTNYFNSNINRKGIGIITLCLLLVNDIGLPQVQAYVSTPIAYLGKNWIFTQNAVVWGNNVEYLYGLSREQCVTECINAKPPAKNYDCWSVEFIGTGDFGNCRTQSKTLFGSNTGYVYVAGTDLYERSCEYVDYLGVDKKPEQNVPYEVETSLSNPSITDTSIFNIEYEVLINDSVQPYFKYNLTPYPETCVSNCKIDYVFTVEGSSCTISWPGGQDTTASAGVGIWLEQFCQLDNKGLNNDRSIQFSNMGKVTVLGGAPYYENTFEYKIEAVVVGFTSFMIQGKFKLLCHSVDTVIGLPADFSTDIILFLKSAGTHAYKISEFTTTQCPIAKYEITEYVSNESVIDINDQVAFDTSSGCILQFLTGDLSLYSQVGTLCKTLNLRSDRHFEKHQYKIKVTAQGILHPKGIKEYTSSLVTAEVVCGPSTSSLSVSFLHNLIDNQQYLPGIANVGSVLPQHVPAEPRCQVHTYEVLSSNDLSNCQAVKYDIKKTSLGTGQSTVDRHQCQSQDDSVQVGATQNGYSLSQCTSYCLGLGAQAFRMRSNSCYCHDNQCSTIMLDKIKGADSNNWTTYRFECTSSNIYSSIFQSASNIFSTISSSARKANMIDASNALVSGTFYGSIMPELVDIYSLRTETFYIHSKADGGSTLMQGPYKITLKCDESILITPPVDFETSFTFELDKSRPIETIDFKKFSAWYPDDPSRNIEMYCPILSYTPTFPAGITQPACNQTPQPVFVNTGFECNETGAKRITMNWKDNVANRPHTVETCNAFCSAWGSECVEFALGQISSYLGRCDLYRATDCTYHSANNFAIYRPVPDPCRTLKFDSLVPITYNTEIKVLIKGGSELISNTITVIIKCGPNSATLTTPPIDPIYIYPLLVQDPDMPRVEHDAFTTDQPLCPIETYKVTHDGISQPVTPNLQSIVDYTSKPGKMITRVIPSRTYVLDNYQYYITVTAKGGQTYTSPKVLLQTICNVQSTNIIIPWIEPLQLYGQGESAASAKFGLFPNSQAECPNEKYVITTSDPTILHPEFKDSANVIGYKHGSSINAQLNDIMIKKNYTYYILVEAKGGNKVHAGPFYIRIGCHPGIPITYDGALELNKTYPLRTDRDKVRLQFDILGMKSANPFCSIWNYELIYSLNTPDLNKIQRPYDKPTDVYMFQNCTSPPCNTVEFTQHYPVEHKFWVLVTSDGGGTLLLPQFTRIIKETQATIISANLCANSGVEIPLGINDADYRGCQGNTRSGKICLPWESEVPKANGEVSATYGTDGGHNYCRNPDGAGETLWCYVGDPANPTKELCDPIGVVNTDLCVNSDERLTGIKDDGYRGCQAQTISGKTCQPWNSQAPHTHNDAAAISGTDGTHSFCRNPGGKQDTIWCYTNDPNTPWEKCQPLGYTELNNCDKDETLKGDRAIEYRGCQGESISGKACLPWDTESLSTHNNEYAQFYGTAGSHNFCRNPDGKEDTIWCFVGDPQNPTIEKCAPIGVTSCVNSDESLIGKNDEDYRGCQTKTQTGEECLPWNSETPTLKGEVSPVYGTDGDHSFCRNPDGGGETIWCYAGDPQNPTKQLCDPIGYVDPNKCLLQNEVLTGVKDDLYRGCQTQTRSGKTCQAWDSQVPHVHNDADAAYGTDGDHSYCRNPSGKQESVWCYTNDPDTPWELCFPIGYVNPDTCNYKDENLKGDKDAAYRGCQATTRSGQPCLPWNSDTPRTSNDQSEAYGTNGDHSYCRNPNGKEETIWCYSGDPENPTKEMCDPIGYLENKDDLIDMCGYGDESLKGVNASAYSGCQGKTRSGKTCQSWDSQIPHAHSDSSEEAGTVGNNFCRNPDGKRETIWCYTADPETPWELCDPVGSPTFENVDDFTQALKKRLPVRSYIDPTKPPRKIEMEIVKISSAGIMDIDFSETLHSFDYFEQFGLNKTFWAEIQYSVLNVTYYCNQEPYNTTGKKEGSRNKRMLESTNDWWTPAQENEILPNLTHWSIEQFTSQGMKLQLNFTNPLLVSAYFDQDLLNVQILKDGFFFSALDYTYIEENYTMTAKVIPPLLDNDNYSNWSSILVQFLLLLSLFLPMMLMFCMNLGMGRVWSLYFMLQLVSNFENFREIKFPANVSYFIGLMDEISNFKISAIGGVKKFMKQEWTFEQNEMVFSIVVYFVILAVCWAVWKNWSQKKSMIKIKKILLWSPLFRCIMMTWFATCIWTLTYFNARRGGFEQQNLDLENPQVKGKGNNFRILVGLDSKYPTNPTKGGFELMLMPFFKLSVLILFPVLTYIWLQKNQEFFEMPEVKIKFSTLYTDMNTSKSTATQSTILLCFRRLFIVLTTVLFNQYIIITFYVYFYGSLWLLSYYITRKPFEWKWAYALELMNESFVIVATYFMACFSEYILDIQTRYQLGNLYIDLIVIVIILNQVGIWYEVGLAVLRKRREWQYNRDWKAYLEYKESLVREIIEMRKVSTTKIQFETHMLKKWSNHDLEAEIQRLMILIPAPQSNVVAINPPKPEQFKNDLVKYSFAAFMNNEKNVEIKTKELEIKSKMKVSFASFMDNEQSVTMNEYKDLNQSLDLKPNQEKENKQEYLNFLSGKIQFEDDTGRITSKNKDMYINDDLILTPRWENKTRNDGVITQTNFVEDLEDTNGKKSNAFGEESKSDHLTLSEQVSNLVADLDDDDEDDEVDIKINWNGLTKKIYKSQNQQNGVTNLKMDQIQEPQRNKKILRSSDRANSSSTNHRDKNQYLCEAIQEQEIEESLAEIQK